MALLVYNKLLKKSPVVDPKIKKQEQRLHWVEASASAGGWTSMLMWNTFFWQVRLCCFTFFCLFTPPWPLHYWRLRGQGPNSSHRPISCMPRCLSGSLWCIFTACLFCIFCMWGFFFVHNFSLLWTDSCVLLFLTNILITCVLFFPRPLKRFQSFKMMNTHPLWVSREV